MVKKARYVAGMNDFEYCISLHIEHPKIDPNQISTKLSLEPRWVHRIGDERRTPIGRPLKGVYDKSYWTTELELVDGMDLPDSLRSVLLCLRPNQEFLNELTDEGGVIDLFVGIFAKGLCDYVLPNSLLREFADFRIDLRLDYYHS